MAVVDDRRLRKRSDSVRLWFDEIDVPNYIIENDRAVFLEVNTIPGMTETSLIPKAAAHSGINFDQVVEEMLANASVKL